jgi:phosphorylcholine metabolism protein LicD
MNGTSFWIFIIIDENPGPLPEFLSISGVNVDKCPENVLSFSSAIDLFLPNTMMDYIVNCTNEGGDAFFADNPAIKDKVRGLKWRPVTVNKLRKFVSYLVNMTIEKNLNLPSIVPEVLLSLANRAYVKSKRARFESFGIKVFRIGI